MSCPKPLVRAETHEAYKNQKGGISYKVEWLQRDQYDQNRCKDLVRKGTYRRIDLVPCGQCIECRLNYSRDTATKCMLEKKYGYIVYDKDGKEIGTELYPENTCWFLTLTYADEYLPTHHTIDLNTGEIFEGISVNKTDMQKFWKRTRKKYKCKIRYLQCGEYGSKTMRPHYHAIVFGLPLDITKFKKIGMNQFNQPYWMSEELNQEWGLGHVTIGRVDWRSCAYVARYTLKKATNKTGDWWYKSQGLMEEWISMSDNLGKAYYFNHKDKIYKTDSVPILDSNHNPVKPPKRFDRLLKEVDPNLYTKIKEARQESAYAGEISIRNQTNLSPEERRKIQEERMKRVIKDLRTEV